MNKKQEIMEEEFFEKFTHQGKGFEFKLIGNSATPRDVLEYFEKKIAEARIDELEKLSDRLKIYSCACPKEVERRLEAHRNQKKPDKCMAGILCDGDMCCDSNPM